MNNFCFYSIFMVSVMSGHFLDCHALCGIPENCVEFLGKIDNSFCLKNVHNYQSTQCCLLEDYMRKNPELYSFNQNFTGV